MSETYKGYGEASMTIEDVRRFVRFGEPGEWRTYFTGVALPYRPGAMWEVAYELSKAGYLMLAQRRVSSGEPGPLGGRPSMVGKFDYMACRTRKPWVEPERVRAKTKVMA